MYGQLIIIVLPPDHYRPKLPAFKTRGSIYAPSFSVCVYFNVYIWCKARLCMLPLFGQINTKAVLLFYVLCVCIEGLTFEHNISVVRQCLSLSTCNMGVSYTILTKCFCLFAAYGYCVKKIYLSL